METVSSLKGTAAVAHSVDVPSSTQDQGSGIVQGNLAVLRISFS